MTDVDTAIAEYRRRVQAADSLADGDLDELEDHLRALIEDLRTAGMSGAEAVTEAARRLGDPRQLAREHTRVRTPFGAASSTARAWSAAVLFVLPLGVRLFEPVPPDLAPTFWLFVGAQLVVAIALAARRSWARAAALGVMTSFLAQMLIHPAGIDPFHLITHELGVLAFVIPWSRRDVTPAAITLALQALAYVSTSSAFNTYGLRLDDVLRLAPTFEGIALGSALAACIGTVLRARWSTYASAVSALALLGVIGELVASYSSLDLRAEWPQLVVFSAIGSGALAASFATFLAWRTTRAAPVRVTA